MHKVLSSLRHSKKQLLSYAKSLPNKDAYAEVFSTVAIAINQIDLMLKDFPQALKYAKQSVEFYPESINNRAIAHAYIKNISEEVIDPTTIIWKNEL